MNRLTVFLAVVCLLFSCRKEFNDTKESQLIRAYLQSQLDLSDFKRVDFNTIIKTDDQQFYKLDFKDVSSGKEFLLLKADSTDHIVEGRIVELAVNSKDGNLNGNLNRYSLQRKLIDHARISEGNIVENESILQTRPEMLSVSGENVDPVTAPLMTKMYYAEAVSRPFLLMHYINVSRAYNNLPTSTNTYVYSYTEPKNDYGGSASYSPPKTITVDGPAARRGPTLDINKMIDCLNAIPDQGAQCTITLCSDVPVDSNPELYVNWSEASPGHCFLKITKSNQGKSATYFVGFYPAVAFKSILTPAPIPGAFVDDSYHEVDAMLQMNITFEQLSMVLAFVKKFSILKRYDIDDFNCTDFALHAFNVARGDNPLVIPKYNIPGGMTVNGTSTPQGLFLELRRMRNAGIERSRITIPTKGNFYVGGAQPCK